MSHSVGETYVRHQFSPPPPCVLGFLGFRAALAPQKRVSLCYRRILPCITMGLSTTDCQDLIYNDKKGKWTAFISQLSSLPTAQIMHVYTLKGNVRIKCNFNGQPSCHIDS